MEVFLNSAWAVLAVAIMYPWLRVERRAQTGERQSFIAAVVLLAILLPSISISDDLWAIKNPAETDTCQRRDHSGTCLHSTFPAIGALPMSAHVDLTTGFRGFTAPLSIPFAVENPALDPIQSRPPPAA